MPVTPQAYASISSSIRSWPSGASCFEGTNYFRNPTLLEFIAENPTRHGSLPANVVEMARVILEAGTTPEALDEALMLVASSLVARESKAQVPLIDLLCDHGADPNSATRTAAIYAEVDALNALLRHGARFDLPVAAAMGRVEDARRLLPSADADDRHWAMAMASQFGHLEIVRLLLDAGGDPNRSTRSADTRTARRFIRLLQQATSTWSGCW